MTKMGVLINLETCSDTRSCMVACKLARNGFLGSHYVETFTALSDDFPKPNTYFIPVICQHCTNPACVPTCAEGVLYKREDGIVAVGDVEKCKGCEAPCVEACPYDAIDYDPVNKVIGKCDMCAERIDAGQTPACMAECLTHSWYFGDMEDPDSYFSQVKAGCEGYLHQLKPEAGTGPNVYYFLHSRKWQEMDTLYSPAWQNESK